MLSDETLEEIRVSRERLDEGYGALLAEIDQSVERLKAVRGGIQPLGDAPREQALQEAESILARVLEST